MIKISEQYKDVIEKMKADAEANVAEATQLRNERETTVEKCVATVTELQNTADSAKSQFSQASRALKKMGRYAAPDPDVVEAQTEPFGIYSDTARKLPQAEADLTAAKEDLSNAEYAWAKAKKELSIISSLL